MDSWDSWREDWAETLLVVMAATESKVWRENLMVIGLMVGFLRWVEELKI
jgi:hypothetical protein